MAALVLIIVIVPATLVNDHLLLLEHGPMRVSDGSRGGMMAAATVGTMGTASHCAPRRPRRRVSAAQRRERKREERERIRSSEKSRERIRSEQSHGGPWDLVTAGKNSLFIRASATQKIVH
jgi:hypothetical protein